MLCFQFLFESKDLEIEKNLKISRGYRKKIIDCGNRTVASSGTSTSYCFCCKVLRVIFIVCLLYSSTVFLTCKKRQQSTCLFALSSTQKHRKNAGVNVIGLLALRELESLAGNHHTTLHFEPGLDLLGNCPRRVGLYKVTTTAENRNKVVFF